MSWWERQWYKLLTGPVSMGSTLDVAGNGTFGGNVSIAGTLLGNGNGTFNSNVSIGGTLLGNGNATFNANTLVKGEGTFGDGTTNYAKFDNTGHLTFAGTAKPWRDMLIEPVARTTGANAPAFEQWRDDVAGTSRGVYLYSFDDAAPGSEKEVFFTMQLGHDYDGGDLHIHVHWIGKPGDTDAAPRWGLEYAWKNVGAGYGDTVFAYSDGVNYKIGGTDTDIIIYRHYISKFAAISPADASQGGISSILICRLFRDNNNAADTFDVANNKCGLLYVDAHYQIARVGSTDEYTA